MALMEIIIHYNPQNFFKYFTDAAAVFGGLLAQRDTSLCHEHINLVLLEHVPIHDNQARLDMVLRFTDPASLRA